jgi:RimJ/RimL family protein N-acetyltransferase
MSGAPPLFIYTERLLLRPFALSDAPDVQRLAGDRAIAETTTAIPHPYEEGNAERWIGTHAEAFAQGTMVNFAITAQTDGSLVGAMGLMNISREHLHAELGYWIGVPFWGRGYATEAARAVLRYAFESLELHRVHATHFGRNPASGRVMQKIGMTWEGCSRQHIRKWGVFEDLVRYGILRSELPPASSSDRTG